MPCVRKRNEAGSGLCPVAGLVIGTAVTLYPVTEFLIR